MEERPWDVVYEVPCTEVALGVHRFDTRYRALVMGTLQRTPNGHVDQGGCHGVDDCLAKAEQLVADGADFLAVGGMPVGSGPEVSEAEELERVIPSIEALHERLEVPISVDTWRASVLREALAAGAVVGHDSSGFADPEYLPVAAAAEASVVATHAPSGPLVPDPASVDDEPVVDAVCRFLRDRADRAEAAGIPHQRVMVDAGLDLGKPEPQSLDLLRGHDRLTALGWPLLLSTADKRFLGALVGSDVAHRREASHAAHALGIALGSRILRTHDVRGARRTADVMAAVLEARVAT
jgi:dihydropteroate synthase